MSTDSMSFSELTNTIRVVEACLLAGKPDRIVPRLRQGRRAEDVEAELAAEAARPPERTAARAPASAQATNDALRDAVEKRFRAQNRRSGAGLINAASASRPGLDAMSKVLRDAKPSQPA